MIYEVNYQISYLTLVFDFLLFEPVDCTVYSAQSTVYCTAHTTLDDKHSMNHGFLYFLNYVYSLGLDISLQ